MSTTRSDEPVYREGGRGAYLSFGGRLGRQNAGSAAIHSFAGKLQDGRTAKTLDSGPAAAEAASASLRV